MTAITYAAQDVETRARLSLGSSDAAIYTMVVRALNDRRVSGGLIADIGCGGGHLWSFVRERFARYIGIDVVRYEDFPPDEAFEKIDLDSGRISLPDNTADVVVSVETIEHLENPRALMREMVRLAKPGGWILVTTPNQLSLLSLLTLLVKHRFQAFQDVNYPAHLTALLEIDLMRIAHECGLNDLKILYSFQGRLVLTPWHYPQFLSHLFPRALSDNLMLIGRTPVG